MQKNGSFAKRWTNGGVAAAEVKELAELLEAEGARAYTREQSDNLTSEALDALAAAKPETEAGAALTELICPAEIMLSGFS